MGDIADLYVIVHQQRDGHDVLSVQFLADDATADGVAVQSDQQVEQRRPVPDNNVLFAVPRTEDLLSEVKGIVLSLFIGQPRVGRQVLQGYRGPCRQRVGRADKDIASAFSKLPVPFFMYVTTPGTR